MNGIENKITINHPPQSKDKFELEWFEKEVLKNLIFYFQAGNLYSINRIFKLAKFQIENIIPENYSDFIILSFLKNLSIKSNFKYFLHNWGKKITLNSVENPLILNNKIKGKILWKNTLRERNFREYPYSLKFVCKSYENDFNTLENILIKSFLFFLKEAIKRYHKALNYDPCIEKQNEDWKDYTYSLLNIIESILNNYYMREISLDTRIWTDPLKLIRGLRKSNQAEHLILRFAHQLRSLLINKDRNLLREYLEKYLIKPDQNKTAELFVLFSLIDNIAQLTGIKIQHALISSISGVRWIIFGEGKKTEIRVFYQKKPKDLSINYPTDKTFSRTLDHFNLKKSRFIPDIIIDIKILDVRKVILIEVKNSTRWSYLREGLFQICQYFEYIDYYENIDSTIQKKEIEKIGLLVVKDLPKDLAIEKRIDSEYPIKIIKFEELKDFDINAFL